MVLKVLTKSVFYNESVKLYGNLDDIAVDFCEEKNQYSFLMDSHKRSVNSGETITETKDRFRVTLANGEVATIINDNGFVLGRYVNPIED